MTRANSYLPLAPANYFRSPVSAPSAPTAGIPLSAGLTHDPTEGRVPTFLGLLSAVYLTSVVILSSARGEMSWVPQVIGVVLGVAWIVVGVVLKGQEIRWAKPISLFVLYVVWELTGLLVTADSEAFVSYYTTQIKIMVVTWICFQCVASRRDVMVCYLLLGVASLFVLYQGIDSIIYSIEYAGKKGAKGVREGTALLMNANTLGEFGGVALLGAVACVMGYKNLIVRAISVGFGIAACYIIAASGSRTAMLGVVTFAASLYGFHFRKAGAGSAGRKILLVFLSLFVLAGSALFVTKLPFFYRLVEGFSSKEAIEEEPRVQYFFRAMEATAEHPVFGLGMGGFAMARLGIGKGRKGHYSHSTVSETLSCTGIPGFLLYFGAQFALFRLLQKARKLPLSKADMLMVNIIMCQFWVYMLYSMVSVMDSHRLAWPLVGCLVGYVWSLNKKYSVAPALYAAR